MVEYVKPSDQQDPKPKKKMPKLSFKKVILVGIGIFILLSIISSISYSLTPKVAVVPISGPIMTQSQTSLLSGTTQSSRDIASQLYSLEGDDSVQSILLDINTPGGSAVATAEIAKAVEEVSQTKPVYALINDVGASGGFWIAVTANKSYASPMSTVGSIGVTSASLSFEEFIEEYNITYRGLTAGEYKDMGTPYRELEPEEREMIQGILDNLHTRFIDHVQEQTNVSDEVMQNYSQGNIFLGEEAYNAGFIDEMGYYPDVIEDMKNGSDYLVVQYSSQSSVFSLLDVSSVSFFPKKHSTLWFMS